MDITALLKYEFLTLLSSRIIERVRLKVAIIVPLDYDVYL
jgi:hypothetical protein